MEELLFPKFYERLYEARYQPVFTVCLCETVKWSDVLIGRHMVYKLNWGCFSQEKCDSDELIPADFLASMCVCTLCVCV